MMMEGETIFLRKDVCDKVDTKVSDFSIFIPYIVIYHYLEVLDV